MARSYSAVARVRSPLRCWNEVIPGYSRRLRCFRSGSIVARRRSGGEATPRHDHQRVCEPLVVPRLICGARCTQISRCRSLVWTGW